ncbi:hypothetical protein C3737_08695 [Aeromonas jandaei]|nr:hypothetical protein MC69_007695 [Aeromonas hydrophila]PPA29732.1 hypothetical protein C3737_08695 [Aeromonas jandaei]
MNIVRALYNIVIMLPMTVQHVLFFIKGRTRFCHSQRYGFTQCSIVKQERYVERGVYKSANKQ